jgi:hypothetical protein
MRGILRWCSRGLAVMLLFAGGGVATAADLAPPPVVMPAPPPSGWSYRFVPYGWLTSMNGTQTVRGRSVKVDASFADIVEKSDTLVALMGDFEARNGPLAVYGDLVWSKIGFSGSGLRTRAPAPGISGTLGASLGLDIEMAIAEVGVAYELGRFGPLSFDVVGGALLVSEGGSVLRHCRCSQYRGSRSVRRSGHRAVGFGRLARSDRWSAAAIHGGTRSRTVPAR